MENRDEFNLIKSLEHWKSELSRNSNMTIDNVYELESHLLDEIEGLKELGLSTEESMIIAKNRIGQIDEITTEYSKINQGVYFRKKLIPYIKGVLMFLAFLSIIELTSNTSILVVNKIGLNDETLNIVSICLLAFSTFALFLFSFFIYRNRHLNTRILSSIPMLVVTIIITRILTFLSFPFLTRVARMSDFGILQLNMGIYKFIIGLIILIISCILFYYSKKDNKIVLS